MTDSPDQGASEHTETVMIVRPVLGRLRAVTRPVAVLSSALGPARALAVHTGEPCDAVAGPEVAVGGTKEKMKEN